MMAGQDCQNGKVARNLTTHSTGLAMSMDVIREDRRLLSLIARRLIRALDAS
jgi:hypothetical protein